jgi:GNAT superfamily N-acetyltransferase
VEIYIKDTGLGTGEAFIEDWDDTQRDWETVCIATFKTMGPTCLVDTIDTLPKFRRKGYATHLITEFQNCFKEVRPIGITDNDVAKSFWKSLNLDDALGSS